VCALGRGERRIRDAALLKGGSVLRPWPQSGKANAIRSLIPVPICDVHEIYRWKETGEVSYERERRIELMIRDGKISRYEMRIVG